jgi:hypothetical protein
LGNSLDADGSPPHRGPIVGQRGAGVSGLRKAPTQSACTEPAACPTTATHRRRPYLGAQCDSISWQLMTRTKIADSVIPVWAGSWVACIGCSVFVRIRNPDCLRYGLPNPDDLQAYQQSPAEVWAIWLEVAVSLDGVNLGRGRIRAGPRGLSTLTREEEITRLHIRAESSHAMQ